MSSVYHFSYVLVKKNLECPRARWVNCKSNNKPLPHNVNKCGTCALHLSQLLKIIVTLWLFRLHILMSQPYKPWFIWASWTRDLLCVLTLANHIVCLQACLVKEINEVFFIVTSVAVLRL